MSVGQEAAMKYRRLGNSGIRISALGLGSMFYGGAQYQATDNPVTKDEATKVINKSLEVGINYLDCADIYGAYGEAERIIGDAISGVDREELFIATKVMMPMSRHEFDRGLNRKHVIKSINRSLANFKTDYSDLYYAHRYDYQTPLPEVIRTMNQLIDEGKIRYWGTSNWSPAELERTHAFCQQHGYDGPIVDQTKYNLLRRYPSEIALPYTLDAYGMGLVPYKILAEGVFGGRYAGIPFDQLNEDQLGVITDQPVRSNRGDPEDLVSRLQQFFDLAASLDLTPAQLTYAFVLTLPQMSSLLMSTRNPERVEENLEAMDIKLEADSINRINELFPLDYYEYDTYHRVKQGGGPDVVGYIPDDMMNF